jgi:hypothetical protein
MSVSKRNAPRSGGRTVAQHQTIGNTALQPEPA